MSYDEWKMDSDYETSEVDRRDWVHVDDVPNTDAMADLLASLVSQLYGRDEFHTGDFESNLEELCDMLNVRIPGAGIPLMIERRHEWKKTA
jgi:hypothetical protein